jgi:hypothetical protein
MLRPAALPTHSRQYISEVQAQGAVRARRALLTATRLMTARLPQSSIGPGRYSLARLSCAMRTASPPSAPAHVSASASSVSHPPWRALSRGAPAPATILACVLTTVSAQLLSHTSQRVGAQPR